MFRVVVSKFIFYGMPAAATLFFVISLIRYISARRQNKIAPDTYSEEQMQRRRSLLVTSSTIFGTLVIVVGGFTALLYLAVAYM